MFLVCFFSGADRGGIFCELVVEFWTFKFFVVSGFLIILFRSWFREFKVFGSNFFRMFSVLMVTILLFFFLEGDRVIICFVFLRDLFNVDIKVFIVGGFFLVEVFVLVLFGM